MIEEGDWNKAVGLLESAETVVVACHVNPDGDALGSMLGLGLFLERQSKRVTMSIGSPDTTVPSQYETMPSINRIVPESQVRPPDVFVSVDCGDIERLEALRDRFDEASATINVDHHVSNPQFGDVNLVDPQAASSSELIFELIRRMGGTPNQDEATCLYTGIVTDTGRFMYSNATPDTLRKAADLRELGVDHHQVAVDVFESAAFDYLHTLGIVLSRARLEDGLVWSWLEREDLGALGMEETEDLIDVLRAVKEAQVAVVLKETDDDTYKVSLRSRTDEVDVSEVARKLGGGGHKRAAGCTLEGTPEECIRRINEALAGR